VEQQRERLPRQPGSFAKFAIPTVANGKVYVPTFSNQLVVYGLLRPARRYPAPIVRGPAE